MAKRKKATVVETPEEVVEVQVEKIEEVIKPMTIKSLSSHSLELGGVFIPAKGEIILSGEENERTMRKINHALKIKLIKEV